MTEQGQMQIKYAPALTKPEAPQFNFEEIKTQLTGSLEKYKNLVVTEESIQEAKKTKADLNKFKTMIDDERKRVKRFYEEPYLDVKPKFDELYNLIDEPVKEIDTKLKSFETKEKEQKKADITELYEANIGELKAIVPIQKIYTEQWENKGYTLKKVEKELVDAIEHINSDLRVISNFKSEFETELRATYLEALNLEKVLYKKESLEKQKQYQEEQKQKAFEAAEQAKQEVQEEIKVEAPQPVVQPIKETLKIVEPVKEKVHRQEFFVEATKSQLIGLAEYMDTNGIKYGVLPKAESIAG